MKKTTTITAAVMAGLVGFSGVAGALTVDYTPSKRIEDIMVESTLETSSTNDSGKGQSINETKMDTSTSNQKVRDAAASATKFFDEEAANLDDDLNAKIFACLGEDVDSATCAEAGPLVLDELKDEGDVRFKLQLSTSYRVGDYVAVLVGVADADGNITYYVVQGQINEDKGVIFDVSYDVAKAINEGYAFYAIYSADSTIEG